MDYEINRHQLKSQNVRRKLRVYQSFLANISQRRNGERYQKRKKYDYTLFRVHLHYSINKEIIVNEFYCPWHQHWTIWVMDMRHNISLGVSKSLFWKFRIKDKWNSAVIFLWDTTKKKEERLNPLIEEWNKSTPCDIFRNQSNFPTVCLLVYKWHRNNNCITVCGKWIFDSNFEVSFPLTHDCLNYICCGNDTNEIRFVGVLHAIREVPTKVVQRILNMK